jgi:hypothetical protein
MGEESLEQSLAEGRGLSNKLKGHPGRWQYH